MKISVKFAAIGSALLAISGCAYEAGSQIDHGFGNATMHNELAQICYKGMAGAGKGGKMGGALADPVVVLDPSSTVQRPIYRVHCDGRLDGKYAQVIYNEYVASAVSVPTNAAITSQTGATSGGAE